MRMSAMQFDPKTSVPEQTGRIFFITGGTTGLGAESLAFIAAQRPGAIYFSGRNKQRGSALIEKVQKVSPATKLEFIECDLSNLASVKSAAQQFRSSSSMLHVLMCNAGIMATPSALSTDGYEIQFATNHIGHALLIKLLLPCLQETAVSPDADVRIINLSSVAYKTTPNAGIEFGKLKIRDASYGPFYNPNKWMCYGQSKLANLLYPIELAKRYPNITSVAVHPGFIKTDLHTNENFMDRQIVNMIADKWVNKQQGAYNQTWAATTAKTNLENGAYYEPVGRKTTPVTKQGKDMSLATKLWDWTEDELSAWA